MAKPEKKAIDRFFDDRGIFSNINLEEIDVKRTYFIENTSKDVVRGFHGHSHETKMFYIPYGDAKFVFFNVEDEDEVVELALSSEVPEVIVCPAGWYNGFKPLSEDTIIMCFSDSNISESVGDDYRKPWYYKGEEIWQVKSR